MIDIATVKQVAEVLHRNERSNGDILRTALIDFALRFNALETRIEHLEKELKRYQ